jgi:acetylornithine aminotransferase
MIGIELKDAGTELAVLAKVKGVLLNITGGGRVVRLLPPLIMNQSEADLLVNTVSSLIRIYAGEDSTD